MLLVYIGQNATVNVPRILDEVRAKYPLLKEHELHEVARRTVEESLSTRPPRYEKHVINLLGDDALSEDLVANMQNWRWMTPDDQLWVKSVPLSRRRAWLDQFEPRGLEHSYTWRRENNWTQDVTPHDVEILRYSDAKTWFISADRSWQPVRNFEYPVIERQTFSDAVEAKKYEKEQRRHKQWIVLPTNVPQHGAS